VVTTRLKACKGHWVSRRHGLLSLLSILPSASGVLTARCVRIQPWPSVFHCGINTSTSVPFDGRNAMVAHSHPASDETRPTASARSPSGSTPSPHSRRTNSHHIRHWIDGGATSLVNLTLLCGYHHTWVHQRDLTATATARGSHLAHLRSRAGRHLDACIGSHRTECFSSAWTEHRSGESHAHGR